MPHALHAKHAQPHVIAKLCSGVLQTSSHLQGISRVSMQHLEPSHHVQDDTSHSVLSGLFLHAEEVQVRMQEVDGRVSVAFTAPGAAPPGASEAAPMRPQTAPAGSGTPPVPAATAEDRPHTAG